MLARLFLAVLFVSSASAADLKFEVFKDKEDKFRWRLLDGDAEIGNGGQGYAKKADAMNGAERIKKDGTDEKKVTFEVYEDNAKKFRWRAKATNGNVIAASNKGYEKKDEAEAAVKLIKDKAGKAEIAEVKESKEK